MNASVSIRPWVGFDLDGTLAHYDGWKAWNIIGAPIMPMVERLSGYLSQGQDCKIMTARVAFERDVCLVTGHSFTRQEIAQVIQNWLITQCLLPPLAVTHEKDYQMIRLYDDRAIQVIPNTGQTLEDEVMALRAQIGAGS